MSVKIHVWSGAKPTDASFHYRVNAPLTELAYASLAQVKISNSMPTDIDGDFDVLINHHMVSPEFFSWWQETDRRSLLVIEHDDDYLNLRQDHGLFNEPGSWAAYNTEVREEVRRSLAAADLITVSTPHLAEVYRPHTEAPIVVLPNTVDEVLFEVPQRHRMPDEQLIVGWGGTPSHTRDWQNHGNGIRYGLAKANAKMMMMGTDFRPLLNYPNTEFVPWTNRIDEYYAAVHSWHVVVAPLTDELWSRSKSCLKALEAAALGVPAVVGDATPYRDFVVNGETGFICRNDDEWMRALRALVADEAMRVEMGARARERARSFVTADWAPVWAETYAQALAAKRARVSV